MTNVPQLSIKPPRPRPGSKAAIVSPSAPGLALFPHRAERGVGYLRSLGLEAVVLPNAAKCNRWTAGSPQERADDLHRAFADPDVSVVLCATGGNHANQVVPYLDWDLIRANPKIFQGYSDITTLLWAIGRHAGLRTFHGPTLLPELGEYPQALPFTDRYLRAAWFGDEPLIFAPAESWTDEFLDWTVQADLKRPRRLKPSDGWQVLRPGAADGPLIAGCLETVCWHLKGSTDWLDLDGAVLVLEPCENCFVDVSSPPFVDAHLTDLVRLGVFDRIAALVFGRPYGYRDEDVPVLWDLIRRHTAASGIPVLANVDCGHTDPMLTLPLGARARVDAEAGEFRLLETATVERLVPMLTIALTAVQERALRRLVGLLDAAGACWQFTGGFAGNLHGSRWPLHDLDVDVARDDLPRFAELLAPYTTFPLGPYADDEFELVLWRGEIEGQAIDVSQAEEGYARVGGRRVPLDVNLTRRQRVRALDLDVWVQPLDDLIAYKKLLGRSADLLDLQALRAGGVGY
ncbi:MAG TPA: S66 peptidase family protein [Gemmataceae bacterium]|nr:S66 peptidase family protein [Gemmataceae bacterium]